MIQGGGFEPGMNQKATKSPIQNEANNGLKKTPVVPAMARTQAPHSATAQFFINVVDNDFLNFSGESLQGWGYCVFAEVVEGMDVVDKNQKRLPPAAAACTVMCRKKTLSSKASPSANNSWRHFFIADLHLQTEEPAITAGFSAFFYRGKPVRLTPLYILGDLFEAWIGDDDPNPLHQQIASAIKAVVDAGVPLLLHPRQPRFFSSASASPARAA